MATKIPRQALFFYKSNWTAEVDSVMLSLLVRAKHKTNWSGSVIPINILEVAAENLTAETGVAFTWRELYIRFQFFEQRYLAFKEVLRTNGVSWNVNTNVVSASELVWKRILKENSSAAAYYFFGDPEFGRLEMLFGNVTVTVEPNTDVVVISDTTEPIYDDNPPQPLDMGGFTSTLAVSDSVNSPLAVNMPKMRRKLFTEGEYSLDEDTSYERSRFYYEQGPAEDPEAETELPRPPRLGRKNGNPSASPHGSSCGSTNIDTWWRRSFN